MNGTSTWPDRSTYAALMQRPAEHLTDSELATATYARGAMGMLASWNGARAIVFRARLTDGSSRAVRFLLTNDQTASTRYDALGRHLSVNPVATLVRTDWIPDGLRSGSGRYPLIKMDWVDGFALDPFIDRTLALPDGSATMHQVAQAWLAHGRALQAAEMSHGDVHAGNAMVVAHPGEPVEIKLVDYDNVWVPGLHAACQEAGHPAFQHPVAPGERSGPHMDAFPNALTYLSLAGLAADPGLWRFHEDSDDTLLFSHTDLTDTHRDVWLALHASPDPTVTSLADVTEDWLRGGPEQFHTLEQVLVAVRNRPVPAPAPIPAPRPIDVNRWPAGPHPAAPAHPAAAPPDTPSMPGSAALQNWPAPVDSPPALVRGARPHRLMLVIALLVIAVIVVVVIASA